MQPEPVVPAGLPQPDADALRHSERVAAYIRRSIAAAGGRISFGEYMQHALYAPALGYYSAGSVKFGRHGDFITAPEISPLFGRVLARQCAAQLRACAEAEVLEIGAGSGALAVAMLGRLAELDALPARYLILEVSADLSARQRHRIAADRPDLLPRVRWVSELPEKLVGVVIANEVADALPVERFERGAAGLRQVYVAAGDDGFVYETATAGEPLAAQVQGIERELGHRLAPGYRSEVSLGLSGWVGDLVASLGRGLILLFDYGLSRREYYAPERDRGWLRCHFRHRAHDEPLLLPGIQDITAWVDFSAVAEAAARHGAHVGGFVTQAMFLLNGGLDNEFAELEVHAAVGALELARQAKLLTLPTEMGENFKCMALIKGDVPVPDAFAAGDRAHTL